MSKFLPLVVLCLLTTGCPGPIPTPPDQLPILPMRESAIAQMFETADCSGDKKLTEAESRTMIGIQINQRIGSDAPYRPLTVEEFKQGDANQDKVMTLEELTVLVRALGINGYAPAGSTCPPNTPAS